MDLAEGGTLQEILSQVRPYLNSPDNLENAVEKVSANSSNPKEFEKNFEKLISDEKDPSREADYRIFLNKFRSR